MRTYSYRTTLEVDPDGGVLATFPDVPGAIAHGRTEQEAVRKEHLVDVPLRQKSKGTRSSTTTTWKLTEQTLQDRATLLLATAYSFYPTSENLLPLH